MSGTSPEISPTTSSFVVPQEKSGTPLLEFLSSLLVNESKISLRRLIAQGHIRVNGRAATPNRRLLGGEVVTLPEGVHPAPPAPQRVPLRVLYEDADLLCVDKPPGYPVLPGRGGAGREFYESLVAHLNRDSPPAGPFVRPHVVHRLDRLTSGVLLVAKHLEAGRRLGRQFMRREVEKTYLGLIEGVLPCAEVRLDIPLERLPGSALQMRPAKRGGKPASTIVRVQEAFGHFCLLCIRPLTGRQHQVRVHLAAAGYPLAVDHQYGRRSELKGEELNRILGRPAAAPDEVLLCRCPLHAFAIRYTHPSTGERMEHQSPLPEDMSRLLELLRRHDAPRQDPAECGAP